MTSHRVNAGSFILCQRISLNFLGNIVRVTFLQNFLEGHNMWCQDGGRSPISWGNVGFPENAFFLENSLFLSPGLFCLA
jgi:hypothetical protein